MTVLTTVLMRARTATLLGVGGAYAALQLLGRQAGSTREERAAALRGDDLVNRPQMRTDHAVTAGSSLAGIIGAFLSVPIAALIAVIYRYTRDELDGRSPEIAPDGTRARIEGDVSGAEVVREQVTTPSGRPETPPDSDPPR